MNSLWSQKTDMKAIHVIEMPDSIEIPDSIIEIPDNIIEIPDNIIETLDNIIEILDSNQS